MSGSPIAQAVQRHRLADVARRTAVALSATTGALSVRCPMPSHRHPDRSPSMRLYLDHDRYYCFGCGAKGDVVQWVRDAEAVGVAEAIKLLDSGRPITNAWAGREHTGWDSVVPLGVASSTNSSQMGGRAELPDLGRTPPDRVFAALDAAWGYYTYRPLHARGAAYLADRSIQIGLLESHTGRPEVGHTPARPDGLVNALRCEGFSDDELVDAGLAQRRQGVDRLHDFYRQRVLVPIRDSRQRVCGFVGRNIADARWPKYKNPPTTVAYDKSVNLYQPLPPPGDPHGQLVVVEGTIDALAIATSALKTGKTSLFCPLTQSGRELSEHQIRHIISLHPAAPVLAFDSDPPGFDSAFRYALCFAAHGKAVTIAHLHPGHDPASWLAEHGDHALSTWSRNNHSCWDGPAPIPAATFAARYIQNQDRPLAERMEALVEAANLASRLEGRTARLWAQRVAGIAGPVAVAATRGQLEATPNSDAAKTVQHLHLFDRQTKPPASRENRFETALGPEATQALIQGVAAWGRRLPHAGDPAFILSASAAVDAAGILGAKEARGRLHEMLGRIERCIDPAEAVTLGRIAEVIAL